MAGDVAAVQQMFDRLLASSHEVAKRELEEITDLAQKNGHVGPLAHWDVAFWSERLREQRFSFTDEQLRPYFSLDRVLNGLFELCHRLFGITVKSADGESSDLESGRTFLRSLRRISETDRRLLS
jgi:oligopeptidase A